MPQYGIHRYGTFKYGKYKLVAGSGAGLGPHVRYRIRNIASDGKRGEFLTVHLDRLSLPGQVYQTRLRAGNGEWVYTQNAQHSGNAAKVRIRSIQRDGSTSDWVLAERGDLLSP